MDLMANNNDFESLILKLLINFRKNL